MLQDLAFSDTCSGSRSVGSDAVSNCQSDNDQHHRAGSASPAADLCSSLTDLDPSVLFSLSLSLSLFGAHHTFAAALTTPPFAVGGEAPAAAVTAAAAALGNGYPADSRKAFKN